MGVGGSIRGTNDFRLWNVKSVQTVKKVVLRDLTDFCGFVTSCECSPDGQYIAVSTSQEQLCILRATGLCKLHLHVLFASWNQLFETSAVEYSAWSKSILVTT